jgi:hypothetical protein
MPTTLYGALLFLVGFFVHVVLWRVRRPVNTTVTIILVFVVSISFVWLTLSIFDIFQRLIDFLPQGPVGKSLSLLLALAIAMSYIMTYPALENDSPTLKLVNLIAQKERIGATEEELFKEFSNKNTVEPSINEMISEGLVRMEGQSILLTERGHRLATIYRKWRVILGAEMGG